MDLLIRDLLVDEGELSKDDTIAENNKKGHEVCGHVLIKRER